MCILMGKILAVFLEILSFTPKFLASKCKNRLTFFKKGGGVEKRVLSVVFMTLKCMGLQNDNT